MNERPEPPVRPQPLTRLLAGVEVAEIRGEAEGVTVGAVTDDSRHVTPGTLFVCVAGQRVDGHEFAGDVVGRGAVALVVERLLPVEAVQVVVPSARRALAQAAAALHGHPAQRLTVVGITGTNGKTTTAHLLASVLDAGGRRCGVLGTLSGSLTTAPAPALQAALSRLVAAGVDAVAMEVSSHALDQQRADAIRFAVAVFTNLSRDHLDYHGSMERYFSAKASLFNPERADVGVINGDDAWGRRLAQEAATSGLPVRTFSMADAVDLELDARSSTFRWQGETVRLPIGGDFNVSNALAAAAAARELGIGAEAVAAGLSSAAPVPGRFEVVEVGQPFTVVVDYAHTPEGLERVLNAARLALQPDGRLVTVFGCGGDRDHGKRADMGEVATRLSDLAVLTSDNPRSEDPSAILAEVAAGAQRSEVLVVEPDRAAAIGLAIADARAGDVVIIAGKGHEQGQIVGDRLIPFDDREVARAAVAARERVSPPSATAR